MNGYDEEKDVVQKFVDKEGLKQPILLMGQKVAFDLYGVEAFPSSFWIDRQGKLVAREIGFDPSMFPHMERRVEKLLAAPGAGTK